MNPRALFVFYAPSRLMIKGTFQKYSRYPFVQAV